MSDALDRNDVAVWRSPLVWAAGCWVVGTMVGREQGWVEFWLAMAGVCLVGSAWAWRKGRWWAMYLMTGVAVIAIAAGWWGLRVGPGVGPAVGAPGLRVSGESRLVELEGVIEGEPYIRVGASGLMGRFDYRPPKTRFVLRVDREYGEGGVRAVEAGVVVDLPAYDGRLRGGDRVRCIGWLRAGRAPMNPGEFDYARMMRDQGVVGRLSLDNRGNCRLIEVNPTSVLGKIWATAGEWREWMILGARLSLREGMADGSNGETAALLEMLFLGSGREELGDLEAAFRETGLAHLLAISGANMAILVAGTWWLVMAVMGRPRWAAGVALGVIGSYLLIVPPNVPILRAGLMAALVCVAMAWGRRVSAMAAMSLAVVVLLMWRPGDLFSAGFQLSFVVVAGMILFTSRVSERMMPRPLLDAERAGESPFFRRCGDYVAVSLVAWLVAMPLVAYHFQAVSPMALLLGLPLLPVVAVLLWVGYVKVLLTAVWPAVGAWLGGPLWLLGEGTAEVVRWAAEIPLAAVGVPTASAAWAAAALAVVAALLGGRFAGRRRALAAAVVLCVLWLFTPLFVNAVHARRDALRINMFAVGDGSCYLLRSGGEAMIFDCGSSGYLDITTVAIGPALHALGVTEVPTLILSHPDSDHFSGSLELIDGFGVERVVTTRAFLDEAAERPWSAAAFVIEQVKQRGVPIETAHRGWTQRLGHAELQALWPPAGRRFEHNNDSSLVIRVCAGGRRILLTGDVQQEAMTAMLGEGLDLEADIVELPHHGSFVDAAPAWLAAVDPAVVLQSSGFARLRHDRWADRLAGITRHITTWHGMVELRIDHEGVIHHRRFLKGPVEPARRTNVQ